MFLQEVYASEAIDWTKEDFVNNDNILSLYNEVGVANVTLFNLHCYSRQDCGHALMKTVIIRLLPW